MNKNTENKHWKIRFNERNPKNWDINDPSYKNLILEDIKLVLTKYPDSVQQSATHKNRVVVTGKDGLHYVLQKNNARN